MDNVITCHIGSLLCEFLACKKSNFFKLSVDSLLSSSCILNLSVNIQIKKDIALKMRILDSLKLCRCTTENCRPMSLHYDATRSNHTKVWQFRILQILGAYTAMHQLMVYTEHNLHMVFFCWRLWYLYQTSHPFDYGWSELQSPVIRYDNL